MDCIQGLILRGGSGVTLADEVREKGPHVHGLGHKNYLKVDISIKAQYYSNKDVLASEGREGSNLVEGARGRRVPRRPRPLATTLLFE